MGRSIRPYDEGDVMAFCFSAGGAGYGDPLEADPEEVARDFVGGLISAWTMREIYKVAYDEARAGRAGRGDRAAADRGARRASGTRHGLGDVRGRRGRSCRRPRTCWCGSAPGPRASPRRRSCECERARRRTRRQARRPPAAGAAVRGARGAGRGARRARVHGRSRPSRAHLRGPRADVAPGRAGGRQRLRLGRRGRGHGPRLERRLPAGDRMVVVDVPRPSAGDPGPMVDLLRRVRAVVPEPTLLATTICGPATYAVGQGSLADGARITLAYARAVAEAGANVVFVREFAPELPDGYARAVTPLWGALKFVRAVGVLRAPWAAELPRGPFLPCVTERARRRRTRSPSRRAKRAPAGTSAALITHTEDLAGHVPIRELQSAARAVTVLWTPPPDVRTTTEIGRFAERYGFDSFEALQRWSVDDLEGFWRAVADFYDLGLDARARARAARDAGRRVVPGRAAQLRRAHARRRPRRGGRRRALEHARADRADLRRVARSGRSRAGRVDSGSASAAATASSPISRTSRRRSSRSWRRRAWARSGRASRPSSAPAA